MMFTVHPLPDPSVPNTKRPYLIREVSPCTTVENDGTHEVFTPRRYQLCEITRIGCLDETTMDTTTKYESYILSSTGLHASPPYVIQDGSLYVMTPVDPLFWFLPDLSLAQPTPKPAVWEPLSQFVQQYDPILVSCLSDQSQLLHLLTEMHIEDHEPLVQCSVEKTLLWLQRKQEQLELTLRDQAQTQLSQSKKANGAFCSGFTIAESTAPTVTPPDSDENASPTAKPICRNESIQLVCQYLSPAWRERFLQHLQVDAALVLQASPDRRKRPKVIVSDGPEPWHATIGASDSAPAAPAAKPMTAGAKRLLKATSSSRGLQSISSFFQKGKSK
jgi:hypothetical protein